MATRYVGPGGNDGNDGLSWANRKLTLNGVEDTPVAAADVVYVGPGTYRETLTQDVSGTSGNPITYIGDVTGEHTDGVGGIVRITGSDNDQSATRGSILAGDRDYRTYRGFAMDTCTGSLASLTSTTAVIFEDCYFTNGANSTVVQLQTNISGCIVRRCVFFGCRGGNLAFNGNGLVDDTGCLVENCVFIGSPNVTGVVTIQMGGITVRNCAFVGGFSVAAVIQTALNTGQTFTVNNCLIQGCTTGLQCPSGQAATFVSDFNTLFGNGTNYNVVSPGTNDLTYPPYFHPLVRSSGHRLSTRDLFDLAPWSLLRKITGSGEPSDDFFGLSRPATAAKNSWGPVQDAVVVRETGTVRTGTASAKLDDAGDYFVRRVFVTNVSTVISLYVRWEANYAGTKPAMVLKQPGQSDRVTTAVGSADTWEQLSDTFTPAALPPYVDVYVRSSNTATSGSFATYVDDLAAVAA